MSFWKELNKATAKEIADQYEESLSKNINPFKNFNPILDETYTVMREKLLTSFEETYSDLNMSEKSFGFNFDSRFGLKVYVLLNDSFGMTEADAANDDIWRYIQMEVVPDMIFKRWGEKEDKKFNHKRFYSEKQRIYLKVIWWYIHLIWAGSESETIKNMKQADISQIIDRPEKEGTHVELYRTIMHIYAELPIDKIPPSLFSKIMMLNLTYCASIEPELMDKSVEEYAKMLFREVGIDV